MRCLLNNLEGSKYIFTNATLAHAKIVLQKLGILDIFDDIIDIKLAKAQHQTFKDIINFYRPNSCIEISSLYEDKDSFDNLLEDRFPPINLMYTRDIATIIGNNIFLNL